MSDSSKGPGPDLETLRNGYDRFSAIFQMLPDGITVATLGGIIETVNPAAIAIFGGGDESYFIGRSILEFLQPFEAERAISNQLKTLGGNDPGPDIYLGRRVDGSSLWLELHGELLTDAQSGEQKWLFVARNIDAVRRAELALRERETFLQAIIDHSPVGISVRDFTGRLLRYNEAWVRIWALSEEDLRADCLTPRTALRFDSGDDYLSAWHIELRRVYEQGGTLFLPELKTSGKRLGMAVWVSQYFYALKDENGRVSQVVILTEDISERKRAEFALLESMQSSADLVRGIPAGLMIFVPSERDGLLVADANPAAEGMLGLRLSQIRRKPLALLWPRQEELLPHLQKVLETGEPFDVENRPFDNGLWQGTLSLHAFRLPGERVAVIFKDTTETTRLAREKSRLEDQVAEARHLESIARLAGGLAHNFNNLLTGISGHLDLILMDLSEEDPLHSQLVEINQAAVGAADLTRELLAFSRQQMIAPRPILINETVKAQRRLFKNLLGAKIHLRMKLAEGLSKVRLDPEQVMQMLVSLLVNARSALPEGGQVVIETRERTIQVDPEVPAQRWVQLSVSDNAGPLPEEVRRKLFEPFYTTNELGRGKGLGLASLYGSVTQNGGRIEVLTNSPRGTSYVLSFAAEPRPEGASQTRKSRAAGTAPTLLLAEEESVQRSVTESVLSRQGYAVLAAGTGAKLFEAAKTLSIPPLALFCEVLLPDGPGSKVYERLKELFPELRVVFMSGLSRESLIQRGVLEPSHDFLAKPFAPQDLITRLAALLGKVG